MNYTNALNAYAASHDGFGELAQPNQSLSQQDKNGRWILRNVAGFLAYVTNTGKVLNSRFEQIGGGL